MNKIDIHINQNGFREYDARWLYPDEINLAGLEHLGLGLGTQILNKTGKESPRVVVGYDYRSYSEEVKNSLVQGLLN